MTYRLSSRAERDLQDIYVFGVETFGVRQAERYAAALRDALETIASQPLMCRERREFQPPMRIHVHQAHAIFYVVEGGDVVVVRLLHRARDLRRHV